MSFSHLNLILLNQGSKLQDFISFLGNLFQPVHYHRHILSELHELLH